MAKCKALTGSAVKGLRQHLVKLLCISNPCCYFCIQQYPTTNILTIVTIPSCNYSAAVYNFSNEQWAYLTQTFCDTTISLMNSCLATWVQT